MKIELRAVKSPVNEFYPGPFKPGAVFVFSDDLVFKSIDGVPTPTDPKAGTHSGGSTFRREAEQGDLSLAEGVLLFEYEATFALNAVTYDGKQLDAGQVTARGVSYMKNHGSVDPQGQPVNEKRFAVTGGTGPYRHARGHAFESGDKGLDKRLEIDL
jgi:hypothetical protein